MHKVSNMKNKKADYARKTLIIDCMLPGLKVCECSPLKLKRCGHAVGTLLEGLSTGMSCQNEI